jgi:hypothetical protein
VVWAPLSAANRAKFNETAAVAKFHEMEGLEYGYQVVHVTPLRVTPSHFALAHCTKCDAVKLQNMLYGWIDTVKDNYPCFPPGSETCLECESVGPYLFIIFTCPSFTRPFKLSTGLIGSLPCSRGTRHVDLQLHVED